MPNSLKVFVIFVKAMILRCVQNNICRRRGLLQQEHYRLFSSQTSSSYDTFQDDLNHAMIHVKNHDPAAFLPGKLLPQPLQTTYFAVRSFWIETGLQFGRTAKIPANSTPKEHLLWWQMQVDSIYDDDDDSNNNNKDIPASKHSTIRLLHHLNHKHDFSKDNFDNILNGRMRDLELRDLESNQYQTMEDLEQHALLSCSSLLNLVLESYHSHSNTNKNNNNLHSSAIDEAIKK